MHASVGVQLVLGFRVVELETTPCYQHSGVTMSDIAHLVVLYIGYRLFSWTVILFYMFTSASASQRQGFGFILSLSSSDFVCRAGLLLSVLKSV